MVTSYTGRATRGTDKPSASYQLVITSLRGLTVAEEYPSHWHDLAGSVRAHLPQVGLDPFKAEVLKGVLRAYTERGTPINLLRLLECKETYFSSLWERRAEKGYVRRSTPVPYTAKMRGGGYHRHVKTRAEFRDNHAVQMLEEGGNRLVRPSRRQANLPSTWDDVGRCPDNGWKAQRKGKKNWDRALHDHAYVTTALPGEEVL